MPASLATWRCQANAPAVITPSKTLTASGEHWRRGKNGRGIVSGPPSDRRGFLGLLQGPLNRTAPPAGGGGGGGSVTGPISLSRDIASAAGGCVITVTATAITGTPTVTVNGVTASTVTPIDGTHCSFVVPVVAGITGPAPTTVPVVVGGVSAPNQFQLAPALTTLLFSTGFESGNLLPFVTDNSANGTTTVVTNPVYAGTHAVQCQQTPSSGPCAAQVEVHSPDAFSVAALSKGLWTRGVLRMNNADLAAMNTQIKFHLCRGVSGSQGWTVWGVGSDFSGTHPTQLVIQDDGDTGNSFDVVTPFAFGDGIWIEVLEWDYWDAVAGKGTFYVWVNGLFQGSLTSTVVGSAATDYKPEMGMVFGGNGSASGTCNVFLDNFSLADGGLDPQVV